MRYAHTSCVTSRKECLGKACFENGERGRKRKEKPTVRRGRYFGGRMRGKESTEIDECF